MAEPSETLWQALLTMVASPPDQPFKWRSASGKASLARQPGRGPVLIGRWCAEDQTALELFAPLFQSPRLALAQLGQSLDGRIATALGDSYYINGPAMRTHLHRLRALVDAVVVGAGTAVADQPALTVRHCAGTSPVPVIIDPSARVPVAGPLFDGEQTPRLILIHASDCRPGGLLPAHVECVPLALDEHAGQGGLSPRAILEALAERGLARVLIEGGGVTVSRFIDHQALDRLHLLIAPLIIGSGPAGLNLDPIERLSEAARPSLRSYPLGLEVVLDVDLASLAARS